jgi:hypothetical protein
MTCERIIEWPVKHHGPFASSEISDRHRKELLTTYPVLHHLVWSADPRDAVEGVLVRAALMMAASAGSYNTDTNLALRRLLEARDLHRHTRDRVLIDTRAGYVKTP